MTFVRKVVIGDAVLYQANGRGVTEHVLRGSLPVSFRCGYLSCHYLCGEQLRYATRRGQDAPASLPDVLVLDIGRLPCYLAPRSHSRRAFYRFGSLGVLCRRRLQARAVNSRNSWLGRVSTSETAQPSLDRNHTNTPTDGLAGSFHRSDLHKNEPQDAQIFVPKDRELSAAYCLSRCM